ncbi:hypothetical protein D3C85_925930 [compost metagenome]
MGLSRDRTAIQVVIDQRAVFKKQRAGQVPCPRCHAIGRKRHRPSTKTAHRGGGIGRGNVAPLGAHLFGDFDQVNIADRFAIVRHNQRFQLIGARLQSQHAIPLAIGVFIRKTSGQVPGDAQHGDGDHRRRGGCGYGQYSGVVVLDIGGSRLGDQIYVFAGHQVCLAVQVTHVSVGPSGDEQRGNREDNEHFHSTKTTLAGCDVTALLFHNNSLSGC